MGEFISILWFSSFPDKSKPVDAGIIIGNPVTIVTYATRYGRMKFECG